MIFHNPSGAPELACDQCGCRWFDRMQNVCYECAAPVTAENETEMRDALAQFNARKKQDQAQDHVQDQAPNPLGERP